MGCRAPLDAPGLVLAGNRPLLRAYCTECVTAELLARKLRELREFSPSDPYYFPLMTAHRQSAKTLISLATKFEAHAAKQSSRRD